MLEMTELPADENITPAKQHRISQLMRERILFIQCEGFIRICRSSQPKWFLKDLQSHSPFELKIIKQIPGGLKLAKEIEDLFAGYRHRGQWFKYEGSFKSWIEGI